MHKPHTHTADCEQKNWGFAERNSSVGNRFISATDQQSCAAIKGASVLRKLWLWYRGNRWRSCQQHRICPRSTFLHFWNWVRPAARSKFWTCLVAHQLVSHWYNEAHSSMWGHHSPKPWSRAQGSSGAHSVRTAHHWHKPAIEKQKENYSEHCKMTGWMKHNELIRIWKELITA